MKSTQLTSSPQKGAPLLPVLVGLFAWGLLSTHLEAVYSYPIGIPQAWIDPDVERPPRPNPWTDEVSGYFYVDNINGTDTGRAFGTPSAPRKTIPMPLGPGTYCEVRGIYNSNDGGWTILKGHGTAGAWVANTSGPAWVVGADANNRASLSAKALFLGNFLCVEHIDNLAGNRNFKISTENSSLGYEANYMLIRNCEIDGGGGAPTTAFSLAANSMLPTTNLVIYNNKVHGFGPDNPESSDIDAMGIMVGNSLKNVWILNNEVFDMSGSGIVASSMPSGPSTTSHIYFGRNHVYETWAAGIAAKTSDHVVFSENHIHDIKWTSWSGAKCIGAQYSIEGLWVLFNRCYNGDLGIKVGSTAGPNETNVYVIGNVISDIYSKAEDPTPTGATGYNGAITIWGGSHRYIIGNTIHNCHNGIGLPSVSTTIPHSAIIENNIIANCIYNHIDIDLAAQYSIIRNNLLYQESGTAKLGLGNSNYTISAANALSYVSGLIEADPLFTDTANRDFSIASGSRAVDVALPGTGLTFDVYAAYLADFGVPINVDIAGRPRPAGAGWDIGAYEGPSSKLKVPTPSGARYGGPKK